jgi:hypothetical protein
VPAAEAEVSSEQAVIVPSAELTQALDQMADSALGSMGEGSVDELEASLIGLGTVTTELVETYGEAAEAAAGEGAADGVDEGKDIEALVAELDAELAALV